MVEPFAGIRFVLFGFDPAKELTVRSKLVSGGGQDVGQYSQNCTHVIVEKIVYDDAVCVKARRDGKFVVTGLWVDHSYDVGMPVDPASVMYRPLKDLNGIPGAKNFIMCLTGYQRQDRDDVMMMVNLMGAQFSKPLVANKVTHLICYKFEGEKYDLAKKMKKIKLVNHMWLEDCLSAWQILPEANYTKSGYELEMEAEAKDSEEEADGSIPKQFTGRSINTSPCNIRVGTAKTQDLPVSAQSVLNMPLDPVIKNAMNDEGVVMTAGGETTTVQSTIGIEKPELLWKSPISGKIVHNQASTSGSLVVKTENDKASAPKSVNRSPHFDAGKISGSSYTRKTPRRCSPQGANSSNRGRSKVLLPELQAADDLKSPSKAGEDKDGIDSLRMKTPLKQTSLHHKEELSGISPQKRKMDASCESSKFQKSSHSPSPSSKIRGLSLPISSPLEMNRHSPSNSEIRRDISTTPNSLHNSSKALRSEQTFPISGPLEMNRRSPSNSESRRDISTTPNSLHNSSKLSRSEQTFPIRGPLEMNRHSPSNSGSRDKSAKANSMLNSTDKIHTSKSVGSEKRSSALTHPTSKSGIDKHEEEKTLQTSLGALEEPKSGKELETGALSGENSVHEINVKPDLSKQQPDVKVLSPLTENDRTHSKSLKRKKSLGAKPKYTSEATNQNGSLHINNRIFQNNVSECSNEGTETTKNNKSYRATSSERVLSPKNVELAMDMKEIDVLKSGFQLSSDTMDDETEAPDGNVELELDKMSKLDDVTHQQNILVEKIQQAENNLKENSDHAMAFDEGRDSPKVDKAVSRKESDTDEAIKGKAVRRKMSKGTKSCSKSKTDPVPSVTKITEPEEGLDGVVIQNRKNIRKTKNEDKKVQCLGDKAQSIEDHVSKLEIPVRLEKNNMSSVAEDQNDSAEKAGAGETALKTKKQYTKQKALKTKPDCNQVQVVQKRLIDEAKWFILSGHRLQRKEFQKVIRSLKGRLCRDTHQWSYQATHFIVPDPIRRTEKLFAAAASGRWILKTDYITASSQAGKFLAEEPYEWDKSGLSEDGAVNLEAPRKWRLLRERTGHGAFHGMRIVIYGDCIAPPLDTLKRVVKAGDGIILATSPPYTRFLDSGVHFAIVSPGMPPVDMWVQEFLRHEIPCVVADYLVEYVCKPGYSLERHVQYDTHSWAEKSVADLLSKSEEIVEDLTMDDHNSNDVTCQVCGSADRGEVMLICGNEGGSLGCGIGKHIDCCDPPFEDVPEEDWFCPRCSRGTKSTKSARVRKSTLKSK